MTTSNGITSEMIRKPIKGLRAREIHKKGSRKAHFPKAKIYTAYFMVNQNYKTKYYSTGQSNWSIDLSDRLKELYVNLKHPFLRFELMDAINSLREIEDDCSKSGWDGYEALAVPKFAVKEAELFLNMLPTSIIIPYVSPDPRGGIAFEWRNSRNEFIILTLKGNFILNYAGYFGANNKFNETEPFINSIPRTIIEKLSTHFSE